ncbi:MAG: MBOAT family protein [Lachnospiraceae bacterium]|nr:MBOAT family protein [Lachnospiraceae bacterium]
MVFSSTVFLAFFLPFVLILYYNPFFKGRSFRNTVLLISSLIFYAWGEPLNIFILLISILIGWIIGFKINKSDSQRIAKVWLTLGLLIYIIIFFVFKYLTFLSNELSFLLFDKASGIDILLPIGISFYMFQLMSYLFDIYYKKSEPQKNLLNLGLYIAFFPQLIAGPIVRYKEIEYQIRNRKENKEDFTEGVLRFAFGLSKKVLIADYLAVFVDNIFMYIDRNALLTFWVGAIAYTLQIYFDFSGYSDMAIGLGKIFGFHFSENFNFPYISSSVTEYWRRWHISLSSWFRDYVYIPLGGGRKYVGKGRHIINLLTVWLLTGIWHGANWTFLVWGLSYFVLIVIEEYSGYKKKAIPVLGNIYTMFFVVVLFVIFRAENIGQAFDFIKGMLVVGENGLINDEAVFYMKKFAAIFIIGIVFATPLYKKLISIFEKLHLGIVVNALSVFFFVLALMQCISQTYSPFIYFNF